MDQSQNKGMWDSSPKTTFWLGLFVGIAVSSVLALVLVFGMLMSGQSLARGAAVAQAPAAPTQPSAADPGAQAPQAPAAPVKAVTDADHLLGKKDAKVTVIEYSDFQCPFCGQIEPALEQMRKDFPNDVRMVYRHFPLSFHENAQKAAEASECAAKLGGNDAFWKMHDKLFANQQTLGTELYTRLAGELGLNAANFKKCLDSGETAGIVSADTATGNDAGVNGTPATFINGKLISGAVPYATLKQELVAAGAKN
jgi:protein-disulfide isomerase